MFTTPASASTLTTPDALNEYPGAPFSATAVDVACALVRGSCHWHIAPAVEVTYRLGGDGSNIVALPAIHVESVISVIDRVNGPLGADEYTWSHNGLVELSRPVPLALDRVTVTATVGLPDLPADLLSTIAELARSNDASRTRPPDLRSRTVGGVSYVWATPDTKLIADPLARFEHVLRRYRT